jgi:cell division protease FtsH
MAKKKKTRKKSAKAAVGKYFLNRLRKHFGVNPARLELVTQDVPRYHRPNLHLAIEKLSTTPGMRVELEGIIETDPYREISLAQMSREPTAHRYLPGPVEYQDVEIAEGKRLACVRLGIFWIKAKSSPPVVMLVSEDRHMGMGRGLQVQVMAGEKSAAEDFLRKVSAPIYQSPAFKGQVLSLEVDCYRQLSIQFHRLPGVVREDVILPAEVLQRLDRQSLGMVRHADKLRSAGRHMKRGLLLHGPPGTGKTLSAMYLAALMPGRTVLIITGGGISAIEVSGQLARSLAPVTIILEDVDLIGTMREHQTVSANALLFELLNQMDGLSADADVLFLLTTNRPDVLEPALAARPGRIDQAIEIPLPDEECRRRLIALYAKGLDLRLQDVESLVARTSGVSGAFIRELFRRAAILSLESADSDGQPIVVSDEHMGAALDELIVAGGRFTQRLLGLSGKPA